MCILNLALFIGNYPLCILNILHLTLCIVYSPFYNSAILNYVSCILHVFLCLVYCALCLVYCIVFIVHCARCTLHCLFCFLFSVYCALYILYYTLCSFLYCMFGFNPPFDLELAVLPEKCSQTCHLIFQRHKLCYHVWRYTEGIFFKVKLPT